MLVLITPGVYFYARGFLKAGSALGFTKENRDFYKEKSKLDLMREEEMDFIFKNITRLLLPEISPDGIQFVNRFWFIKDSYKEVYVEYDYQGVKRKVLVHVIRQDREGDNERRIKNLFKYFLFNYFAFEKGHGWKLRQIEREQLALDLQEFGFYEKEPLKILTYILKRENKESKLHLILHSHLILYLTTAYFEPKENSWELKMGNDISANKDLNLYEVTCNGDTFEFRQSINLSK